MEVGRGEAGRGEVLRPRVGAGEAERDCSKEGQREGL